MQHAAKARDAIARVEEGLAAPPWPGATEPPEIAPDAVILLALALGHALLALEQAVRESSRDVRAALDRLPVR